MSEKQETNKRKSKHYRVVIELKEESYIRLSNSAEKSGRSLRREGYIRLVDHLDKYENIGALGQRCSPENE